MGHFSILFELGIWGGVEAKGGNQDIETIKAQMFNLL